MRPLSLLVLVALAGCTAIPSSSSMEEASSGPGSASASTPPSGGLPTSGTADLVGTLGGDPLLEGGCAWLVDDDGQTWEVLWPAGYSIQFRGELTLLVREGEESVAITGQRVGVAGAEATDMASICQVGRIFQASEVVFVADTAPD